MAEIKSAGVYRRDLELLADFLGLDVVTLRSGPRESDFEWKLEREDRTLYFSAGISVDSSNIIILAGELPEAPEPGKAQCLVARPRGHLAEIIGAGKRQRYIELFADFAKLDSIRIDTHFDSEEWELKKDGRKIYFEFIIKPQRSYGSRSPVEHCLYWKISERRSRA